MSWRMKMSVQEREIVKFEKSEKDRQFQRKVTREIIMAYN